MTITVEAYGDVWWIQTTLPGRSAEVEEFSDPLDALVAIGKAMREWDAIAKAVGEAATERLDSDHPEEP